MPTGRADGNDAGRLGDTVSRDYARKLQLFHRFAAPELRQAIASLALQPGHRVLDAGCGSGDALPWLAEAVGPAGMVVGLDVSAPHLVAARQVAPAGVGLVQASLAELPWPEASFDLVWCSNTHHHLHDPQHAVEQLARLLKPGGRLALAQNVMLPEMVFAWDARLERCVTEAVRRYYRERYGLDERELTAVRAMVGQLRWAGLAEVTARTFVIERVSPLKPEDTDYLLEALFRGTWGERLRPYLSEADAAELSRLCDPADPGFALRRPDFHYLQTFTVAVGTALSRA